MVQPTTIAGQVHIGLSGFAYKPWQGEGRFYPPKLKASEYLAYYGTQFDALELDGTWYRLPNENVVAAWSAAVPGGFRFCPKLHRKVTHLARLLEEGDEILQAFVDRMTPLAERHQMGAILVQLPPNLGAKDDRLVRWLERAPKRFGNGDPIRYAFEFRGSGWKSEQTLQVLDEYGAAWVASESDEEAGELLGRAFYYVRLRKSEYTSDELDEWARRFVRARELGRDCFVFCKHEDEGSPWEWARHLATALGESRKT